MAIKESSDELNPTVATSGAVAPVSRPARTIKDYLALALATCGVGYLPLAPGTWGSLLGVGVYLAIQWFAWQHVERSGLSIFELLPLILAVELVMIGAIVIGGIWAASRTEGLTGRKDPGKIVIDEVAGQMIALLPIIPGRNLNWISIFIAFVLFRLFDIVKPYPARHLERLKAGLGVMGDDVVAGAYAAIGTAVLIAALFTP